MVVQMLNQQARKRPMVQARLGHHVTSARIEGPRQGRHVMAEWQASSATSSNVEFRLIDAQFNEDLDR